MHKLYIEEKKKKFQININLNETVKSLYYTYEYIFDKSYGYKVIKNNNKILKLKITNLINNNHCFFKNDDVILYNKNKKIIKFKLLKVNKNYVYIKNIDNEIENSGFIKLSNNKTNSLFVFNSNILDSKKKLNSYNITNNSIIFCLKKKI